MQRIGKIIKVLLVLVVVLVVGLVIFILTFDANQYKAQIAEQVAQTTGRQLQLEGDISVSLFPWLGLETNQVMLANAPGFGEQPFARVEKLAVKVELVPLLKQQISVDKVLLHGLYLSLQQNAQGQNNWADLAQSKSGGADPAAAKKSTAQKTPSRPAAAPADMFAALAINGLEIRDATVVWQDDVSGSQMALDQVNLETGAIVLDEPIPLEFSAHARLNQPAVEIKLAVTTAAKFNLNSMHLVLQDLALQLHSESPTLVAQQAVLKLNTALDAKLDAQQFAFKNFQLSIAARGKQLPGGEVDVSMTSAIDVDVKKQLASLQNTHIETLGLNIETSLRLTQFMQEPLLQGTFDLAEFNPSLLPSQLGIDLPAMQDPTVMQKARVQFTYQATPARVKLDAIQIQLDNSEITGHVQLLDFTRPGLRYELLLNQINLDAYLPPVTPPVASVEPASVNKTAVTDPAAVPDIPVELPLDLLRSIDVQGVVKAGEITAFAQRLQQFNMTVKGKEGVLRVHPLTVQLLDGSASMSARLDVRGQQPQYALDLNARELQAGPVANPLLQNLLGEQAVAIDGAANMTAHVTTQGRSVNALKAALNGQLNINVGKATLQGVDAEYFVRKAVVDYLEEKKKTPPQSWRGEYNPRQTTAFTVMRASGKITNGVLVNQDLLLDSKRLKVTGAGQVNMVKNNLDYRLVVDVQPTRDKTAADKLLDIPLPINVRGDFAAPQIDPDLKTWKKSVGKVLKDEAKAEVEPKVDEKKDELKDKLKDKYENKLKDKFKGLFK